MSAYVMGAFDEVYINPQRCGYGYPKLIEEYGNEGPCKCR
jgi:hypothetical protein